MKQVHLHDQNASGHCHRVIGGESGRGRIDFVRYFRLFQTVEVEDFCIEVRPRSQALATRANLKRLLLGSEIEAEPES